jgi:hypothetical protein
MPAPVSAASRCLTDAEIATVQSAEPGSVPDSLALHLASCQRCQQKALFGDAPRPPAAARRRPDPPSVRRTLVLALIALAAMAAFFWTLRQLTGQMR